MEAEPFWADRDPQGEMGALIEVGRYWMVGSLRENPISGKP
jgi:hypothetical protein